MRLGGSRRRTLGVSLIEAVVALAIVGIGMVGLVGIQASLRMNSDVAKQRSEAVRLAQDSIEEWRGFASIDKYRDEIESANSPEDVDASAVVIGSATYKTRRTVTDLADDPVDPDAEEGPLWGKALAVEVEWLDRNNDRQSVRLSSMITGVAPELAGTLALPPGGVPARNPRGRSFVIPPWAKDLGDGISALRLPGDGAVAWRFNNLSGLITLCTTTAATTPDITAGSLTCSNATALLLSGFVRYATAVVGQPTTTHAADPPGTHEALSIAVYRTEPTPATTVGCYQEVAGDVVRYYCAVPLEFNAFSWSGRLVFGPTPPVAATVEATVASERKICRYLKPKEMELETAARIKDYEDVDTGLANENYLVIKAGNDAIPFVCPDETTVDPVDPPDPPVSTAPHQPR